VTPINNQSHLVTLANVSVQDSRGARLSDICMEVRQGDLLLARQTPGPSGQLLADVIMGLIEPTQGEVRVNRFRWQDLRPLHANALRGRIGRVFGETNWIDTLSVQDNMLLGQLYHTRRSTDELMEESVSLCRQFGLPGLPLGPVASLDAADLQRAACVRAFLGEPQLVLLQRPTANLPMRFVPVLINAIRRVRDRGGAVIWITPNDAVWNDRTLRTTQRFRQIGQRFQEVT